MSLSRDRHRVTERVGDTSEILASSAKISQNEKNQCPVMSDFKEKVALWDYGHSRDSRFRITEKDKKINKSPN